MGPPAAMIRSLILVTALLALAQAASRPSQCFADVTTLGADAQNVSIGYNDWESSRLLSIVTQILLSEKSGIRAERIAVTEDTQWEMLEKNELSVVFEVWPSNSIVNRLKYSDTRSSVEVAGLLGVIGQAGWYMSKYSSVRDPELVNPIWKDLENQAITDIFALNQPTAQMPVTSFPGYEPAWIPQGTITVMNGSFVDPVAQPFKNHQFSQSAKGTVLCDTPAAASAVDEYIIQNLGLTHMEAAYLGTFDSLRSKVNELYADGEDMIVKTWSPNTFFLPESNQNWKKIVLPFAEDEIIERGPLKRDCDYPYESLYKICSAELKSTVSRAHSLVRKVAVVNSDIEAMLRQLYYTDTYSAYSSEDREWMVACDWLKANTGSWEKWIPEPGCKLGQFRNESALAGVGECQSCLSGNYSDSVDLVACKVCATGSFSSTAETLQCALCTQGTYADQDGSTSCQACPPSTSTAMLGTAVATGCICVNNTFQPDGLAGAQCTGCPEGAVCPGGLVKPYPTNGYFEISESKFYECNPHKICPGGADNNTRCRVGHIGDMCTECAEGYFLLHQLCEPCSGDQQSTGAWMFGGVLFVLLTCLILTVISQGSSWFGSAAIMVDFLQVFARFERFDLDWPSYMPRLFQVSAMFNFNIDLLQIECSGNSPHGYAGRFSFSMAVPLMAAAAFSALYGIALGWAKFVEAQSLRGRWSDSWLTRLLALNAGSQIDRADVFNALHGGYVSFLTFAYMFISYKPMELFDCTEQPDNTYTLDADSSMVCWEGTHLQLLPIALLGLILYTVGVPLLLGLQVYRHRAHLSCPKFFSRYGCFYREFLVESPIAADDSSKLDDEDNVYDDVNCTGNWYLWGLTVMARKVAFNISLYFTRYATVNCTVAQIILITCVTVHMQLKPYVNLWYDMLEAILLFLLICVLFCGQVIYKNEAEASINAGYKVMLGMLLVSGTLVFAFFLTRDIVLKIRKMRASGDDELPKEVSTELDFKHDQGADSCAGGFTAQEVLTSNGLHEEFGKAAKQPKPDPADDQAPETATTHPVRDMPM